MFEEINTASVVLGLIGGVILVIIGWLGISRLRKIWSNIKYWRDVALEQEVNRLMNNPHEELVKRMEVKRQELNASIPILYPLIVTLGIEYLIATSSPEENRAILRIVFLLPSIYWLLVRIYIYDSRYHQHVRVIDELDKRKGRPDIRSRLPIHDETEEEEE